MWQARQMHHSGVCHLRVFQVEGLKASQVRKACKPGVSDPSVAQDKPPKFHQTFEAFQAVVGKRSASEIGLNYSFPRTLFINRNFTTHFPDSRDRRLFRRCLFSPTPRDERKQPTQRYRCYRERRWFQKEMFREHEIEDSRDSELFKSVAIRFACLLSEPILTVMDQQRFPYDISQFQRPRKGLRWWLKIVAAFALIGGIYGGMLGAALGAVPQSVVIIEIAAAVLAWVFGLFGARFGALFQLTSRSRFARCYVAAFAAICGAILGGFLATMVVLALGAVMGAVIGGLLVFGMVAVRHCGLQRLLEGLMGAAVGMFVGAILWAIRLNQAAALNGLARGFATGEVVGLLLLLLYILALILSPHTSRGQRENCVDVALQREGQDEGHAE